MASSSASSPLGTEELWEATAKLARCLQQSNVKFSISGGAASSLNRKHHGLRPRLTEDIDLVVQPRPGVSAETVSASLLRDHPDAFVARMVYGVAIPSLIFHRSDGSVKHVDIEMFDVGVWPQRPQYNLDDPKNEVTVIPVSGVDVPVFSARWLVREKIVTAYQRQGSTKEVSDLDDACVLVDVVKVSSVDLTDHVEAVRHIYNKRREKRPQLELKIICPEAFGQPWKWHESAQVYWRTEQAGLRYLDAHLQRHDFSWDDRAKVWYFQFQEKCWYYNADAQDLTQRS
ncbi:hypothetical protein SEPCBS119000_003227 [Sporothrix epigloea]|uniref:Uncharacterized protein n=1 Tax=Sporothrix epigloea TaxID=1892477 RepID=A0ABP0DKJ0_9PEZI